jgi:primase-polymerase (primpol)-like protein
VKVFVRGEVPGGTGRRRDGVEVYSRGRFFTVTGQHLAGTPRAVGSRPDEVRRLCERLSVRAPGAAAALAPPSELTDDEVLARARVAKNGRRFARLWAGDTSDYDSPSEADLALCCLLAFWVGSDPKRIEALFARSGLGQRDKWAERPDYRGRTITAALCLQTEFYGSGVRMRGR